jgi:hypothetical protein
MLEIRFKSFDYPKIKKKREEITLPDEVKKIETPKEHKSDIQTTKIDP